MLVPSWGLWLNENEDGWVKCVGTELDADEYEVDTTLGVLWNGVNELAAPVD